MPSFVNSALRLLRKVLASRRGAERAYAGETTVLDGATAVAVTEAMIAESAGLGGSFPADRAALAWRHQQRRYGSNLQDGALEALGGDSGRAALAAAIGQSTAGLRAGAFLSGADLADARSLLQMAASRPLPLVVQVAGGVAAEGSGFGAGQEVLASAVQAGWFVLYAVNVQEAVDFTLIARRIAEHALVPGLVFMDADATALGLQDVRLPPRSLVERYLGAPDDETECPNEAQRLLFGERRRRVPRYHDLDRPVLLGARRRPDTLALGRAASKLYFETELPGEIERALRLFAELTGRGYDSLGASRVQDAKLLLVGQGALVETLEAVAARLRAEQHVKVGVVAPRVLAPFPGAQAARLLGDGAQVCVVECADTPSAGDPPLLGELRCALDRAAENGVHGDHLYPAYPALRDRHRPRLLSVIHGLGGSPLRPEDLYALGLAAPRLRRSRVFLGLNFDQGDSPYPKRQVLLDRLRRVYPQASELGFGGAASADCGLGLRVEIHRQAGGANQVSGADLAALLHRLDDRKLRFAPAFEAAAWGEICVDRLGMYPGGRAAADGSGLDLAVWLAAPEPAVLRLNPGGALLMLSALPDDALWTHLPETLRRAVIDAGGRVFRLPPAEDGTTSPCLLAGALCQVLCQCGRLDASRRRLLSAWEDLQGDAADAQGLLARFEAGLDAVHELAVERLPPIDRVAAPPEEVTPPAAVRRSGRGDDAYDSLPRFWDQVGVLYRNADQSEMVPDPYLALGAVPAMSAGFRDLSGQRSRLPRLEADLCTACGRCWVACPDAAVRATVLTPAQVLDGLIRDARADVLRPLASKLAAGMAALGRELLAQDPRLAGLLKLAYDKLAPQLPFDDARKISMAAAVAELGENLGPLSAVAADACFVRAEKNQKSTGALLLLAIDPDACKGCGICVSVCREGALVEARQVADRLHHARACSQALQKLPATDAATIEHLAAQPDVDPAAPLLLRGSIARTLSGGDGAEPGSGAKLSIRLAVAAAEAVQAPRAETLRRQVEELRERIAGRIRNLLADALPADDLDVLAQSLERLHDGPADLGALLGPAANAVDGQVDAPRLKRLVAVADGLSKLQWQLSEGRGGYGRAGCGLVLSEAGNGGWAPVFPDNVFASPVVLDGTGDGAALAAGLLQGQTRQFVAAVVLLRKARLELEHPDQAERHWPQLQSLHWRDLDADEQKLCPPLLLVGDAEALAGRGLSELVRILASGLPVKVLVTAGLDLGLAAPAAARTALSPAADPAIELALLGLSQRDTFIAQVSLGKTAHLLGTLQAALTHPGAALVHVHAPSPTLHGFAPERTLQRAAEAVDCRVFPLFRYDPARPGVFGARLDLDGNPEPELGRRALTPAHWAFRESRFADCFEPLEGDEGVGLEVYLDLDPAARAQAVPAITAGENRRYRVSAELVRVVERRLALWRMLQELAGVVTPFTEQVERAAETRVAAERQAELEALRKEYEVRIAALREQFRDEARGQIKDRLMQLAGYRRAAGGEG